MTREELIKKIDAEIAKLSDNASQMCEEYEGYRLACQDISDVLHEIAKEIQPSLPSNLDEAADCYKDTIKPEDVDDYVNCIFYQTFTEYQIADAFKAGAEWREQQIPKLPSNIDEAAQKVEDYYDVGEEHGYLNCHRGDIKGAVKFGAELMAGQFQKIEGKLVDWYETKGIDYCSGIRTEDSFEVPAGFYIKKKI